MPFSRIMSGGIALAVGCLLVFSAPAVAGPKVAAVQVALKRLGLYNATVDGVRGPLTKAAIVHFQARRGLAVDGVVGPQTRRAFGKRGRPAFGSRTMKRGDRGWDVAAMQYILARRGYPPGAIDAVFGPMTDTALRNFQRAYGLSSDGLAGPRTISALRHGRASRGMPGGTTLGYVGSTGHATGPHLHFELRRNAVPIDPMPYLLAAVAARASSARASGSDGGAAFGGGDTGGGVAARECPIREPLVRYRKAPLDACKPKNLTRPR